MPTTERRASAVKGTSTALVISDTPIRVSALPNIVANCVDLASILADERALA